MKNLRNQQQQKHPLFLHPLQRGRIENKQRKVNISKDKHNEQTLREKFILKQFKKRKKNEKTARLSY